MQVINDKRKKERDEGEENSTMSAGKNQTRCIKQKQNTETEKKTINALAK